MPNPTFPVEPPTEGATHEILVMGQRFPLGATSIDVRTYDQPGAMSFYRDDIGPDGIPTYGPRSEKPGLRVTSWEQLEKQITQVVIHTDLTNDSARCYTALLGRSLSTHFMVDWDGVLHQPLDPMDCGYHAGPANQHSIGVDMNNRMKNLERFPDEPPYDPTYARFGEIDPNKEHKRPKSERMQINGARVRSYGYTDKQYLTLIELLKRLIKIFEPGGLKAQFPSDPTGEVIPRILEEPEGFQGFMAHWHWEAQRWDPGPGFDWQRVFHALGTEHNAFPIELVEGKNIKSLLQPDLVREYAEGYYKNNETKTIGWYPMGINQTWHNGIHLAAPRKSPVYAMTDGVLVAVRFGKKPTKLGHNNFVLLRHSVPIPSRTPGAEAKDFVFYSLYMHLEPIDVTKIDENTPNWVKELHRVAAKAGDEDQPEGRDAGDDLGDELAFGDSFELDDLDKSMWLDVGDHGLKVISRGFVSKVAWEKDPIHVLSGEQIGSVGMFGPEDEWRSQIHLEVFADKGWKEAVDFGAHGRYLVELDDDVGNNLFVENRDILSLFGRPRKGSSLLPAKVLDQGTIENFWLFDGEYKEEKNYLRKAVVRHVSEWSDAVDWVESLSSADDWYGKVSDFRKILRGSSIAKDAISTVLPFIWLNQDVAEHIGLDTANWRGVLDFFHPIHFLMWLTYHSSQRVQTLSSGLSRTAAKRKAKEREELTEKCRFLYADREEARLKGDQGDSQAAKCFDYLADEDRSDSTLDIADVFDLPDIDVLKDWQHGSDQGEWRREFLKEDF